MGYAYKGSSSSSVAKKYNRSNTGARRSNNNNRGNRNRGKSQYIDPKRFVKIATPVGEVQYTSKHTFSDFAMDEVLLKNIKSKGYEHPTPIQDQAIPVGLEGKDVVGVAGTGTGKTTAFAVPLINKLLNDRNASALIVAPTRELAQQIEKEVVALMAGSDLRSVLIIGGANMNGQIKQIRNNPRIVIGTPGRIKDHMQRGTLKLRRTNVVVLDEVDRMLDMGFLPDVREILSGLNTERQSFFFSATMDPKIMQLISTFTKDPVTIELQPSTTADNIHQDVINYKGTHQKIDKLHDILISDKVVKVIIFDETKRGVDKLHKELRTRGFSSDSIHGGKSLGQRKRALSRFKNSDVSILVATDVAARGIDVIDVSHVVNYSLPNMYDDYIHRIGRAGRAGQTGYALTFVEQ